MCSPSVLGSPMRASISVMMFSDALFSTMRARMLWCRLVLLCYGLDVNLVSLCRF